MQAKGGRGGGIQSHQMRVGIEDAAAAVDQALFLCNEKKIGHASAVLRAALSAADSAKGTSLLAPDFTASFMVSPC